jgi:hypothetical protein
MAYQQLSQGNVVELHCLDSDLGERPSPYDEYSSAAQTSPESSLKLPEIVSTRGKKSESKEFPSREVDPRRLEKSWASIATDICLLITPLPFLVLVIAVARLGGKAVSPESFQTYQNATRVVRNCLVSVISTRVPIR